MKKIAALLMCLAGTSVCHAETLKVPPVGMSDIIYGSNILPGADPTKGEHPLEIKFKGIPDGGYVASNSSSPSDWHLSMGPVNKPNMTLRVKKAQPNGVILFSCERNTGVDELALIIHGVKGEIGDKKNLYVSVGGMAHMLETSITGKTPDGNEVIMGAKGNAIIEILAAISTNNNFLNITFDDLNNHVLALPPPVMSDLRVRPFLICSGWKKEYDRKENIKKEENNIKYEDLSGSLHTH